MKRKLLILSILAICVATLAAGSLAYFTAEETAHNVITTGSVNVRLIEKTQLADGTVADFPQEGISGVMPGTEASKIVFARNTGEAEAWIRIRMEMSVVSAEGEPLDAELVLDGQTIPLVIPNVKEGWILGDDGYYYYRKPVSAGAETENFMETVTFAPQMGNEYRNCTVTLTITVQAVQTANNPKDPAQYADEAVLQARGWPAE